MNRDARRRGRSANDADYRYVFIARVHQLLLKGYERLNLSDHQDDEEPAITGVLVQEISAVLDDPPDDIVGWCDSFFVQDDPPENTGQRTGKRRLRVDIRFESSQVRPRTSFRFEAKRLGAGNGVDAYLGRNGLGCLLHGDYGPDDPDAGMLGYVQSLSEEKWADKLREKLTADRKKFAVAADGGWERPATVAAFPHTYRTKHERASDGSTVDVYHTLLKFC